jgi:hypothetical protein
MEKCDSSPKALSSSLLTRLFSLDFFSVAGRLVDALELVASADGRMSALFALLKSVLLFPFSILF